MNDRQAQPSVRAYLAAVAQHASALPDSTRGELLANLREHIDVALAESERADEEAVRQILDQLGRPETVAAAALAEEGRSGPAAESRRGTAVTLALLALSWPVMLFPVIGVFVGLPAGVVAAVRVGKSAQWTRKEKRQAILLLLAPFVCVIPMAGLFFVADFGLSPLALLAALTLTFCLPVIAALRLGRSAARLRGAGTFAAA